MDIHGEEDRGGDVGRGVCVGVGGGMQAVMKSLVDHVPVRSSVFLSLLIPSVGDAKQTHKERAHRQYVSTLLLIYHFQQHQIDVFVYVAEAQNNRGGGREKYSALRKIWFRTVSGFISTPKPLLAFLLSFFRFSSHY